MHFFASYNALINFILKLENRFVQNKDILLSIEMVYMILIFYQV